MSNTISILTLIISVILLSCIMAKIAFSICRRYRIQTTCICFALSLALTLMFILYTTALYQNPEANLITVLSTSPTTLWQTAKQTPFEDILPEDKNGSLIFYFRYGCDDCETIFDQLQSYKNNPDYKIYWVNTRSDQGLSLREQYPIQKTPSGVYISQDGTKNYTYILYTKDSSGNTILDEKNLNRLLALQSEHR